MFGLTFEKLLIIGVIAVVLLGPDRLPQAAAGLARLVKTVKGFADGAKTRMRDEMGPEFDEVDWKKLDPRQYDPRRIIREALLEDGATTDASATSADRPRVKPTSLPPDAMENAARVTPPRRATGGPVHFDSEAT